ncbi:MAG TPA: hypothetical protein VMU68_02590 [Acidimicrobiales bacterium]|nr:hypothetical protein [Acidimicrobiales bacterium]
MGLPGMALSAIATATGAIMYWVVTDQGTGVRFSTVGLVFMIAGAIGFVVFEIIFAVASVPERTLRNSLERQVVDTDGRTSSFNEGS